MTDKWDMFCNELSLESVHKCINISPLKFDKIVYFIFCILYHLYKSNPKNFYLILRLVSSLKRSITLQ